MSLAPITSAGRSRPPAGSRVPDAGCPTEEGAAGSWPDALSAFVSVGEKAVRKFSEKIGGDATKSRLAVVSNPALTGHLESVGC